MTKTAIQEHLDNGGFVLLRNSDDKKDQIEAWTYTGSLELNTTIGHRFAYGITPADALAALNSTLIVQRNKWTP